MAKKKVSRKKASKKKVAKKGPDNSPAGMSKLATSLKKGAKKKAKASKKKTAKKKAGKKKVSKKKVVAKVKTPSQINKEIEAKIKGPTVLGKLQMLKLNPKNIVISEGFNPRIDKGDVADLMKSIKQNGVRRPIDVCKVGRHYELVDGERRLIAVLKLGMKDIPAIEVKGKRSKSELLALAVVGNDGKPLAPVEEADAFRRLVKDGWSVRQISVATGKRIQLIKDRIALISAHPDVAAAVKSKKLSFNMGVAIVKKVKGKRAQKRVVKKATKSRAGKKKVAAQVGKPNVRAKFERKAIDLQNRLNKLVSIVNKKLKRAERIPATMVKQIAFFSRHKDKMVRAAYVAGGSLAISEVMGDVNTKKIKKGKRLTARGKQKK